MTSVLDMPVDEILERVEAEADSGDKTAGRILDRLLAELEETGELGVIARLVCRRHFTPGV
jgi:hypothetical protein